MGLSRRAVLAFALVLVGCSSKPSDSEAERLLLEHFRNVQLSTYMDIENVRRTNGFEKDGVYVVEMQYDAVAKLDFQTFVDQMEQLAGDDFLRNAHVRNTVIPLFLSQYGEFKKGERLTARKYQIQLRRTESGWALAG